MTSSAMVLHQETEDEKMRNVHERVKREVLFVLTDPCLFVGAVKSKQCYYGLHEEASAS